MGPSEKSFEKKGLEGRGLACRRGGRLVFEALDFTVEPGKLLFLRGKNGSGKSTLLRLIAGFVPALAGEIRFGGQEWEPAYSEALVYVGHDNGLKPALSLGDNCRIYARIMTGQTLDDKALFEAADVFGLGRLLDQPVRFFSSGQRHRASLMRLLLVQHPVWLLDEPTVGLDAENRSILNGLMEDHLKRAGLILAATHDPISVAGATLDVSAFAPAPKPVEDWI